MVWTVCLCHTSAHLLPDDLWVLPRQGSGCGQRPGVPLPGDWTALKKKKKKPHQPLRHRNRPSYYKHNHAHYSATVIFILSCSKGLYSFDWSTSLCVSPLVILFFKLPLRAAPHFFVQITTCSGDSGSWSGKPQCKAVMRVDGSAWVSMFPMPSMMLKV